MDGTAAFRWMRNTLAEARNEAHRIDVRTARGSGIAHIVRQVAQHARDDALLAFAGNLTYNAFLAIFPFLLFVVSILKVVHATNLITALFDAIAHTLPPPTAHLVRDRILPDVLSRLTSNPLLSVCLALGSLWAVSFVGRAIVQAVNRMYEIEDRRPAWQRFLLPLLFSLGAAVLFVAALALLVLGSSLSVEVGRYLGSGSLGWWVWFVLRWVLLIVLAFLGFGITYYFAPDIAQRAPFVSIGAACATASWLIFSFLFSLVLTHFAQFLISPLYGWFTGLIILLMYLYWSSAILLLGVELNRVIGASARHVRPAQRIGSGRQPPLPETRRRG